MTDQNITNQELPQPALTGLVAELVGADKKFKTLEDLAKGKQQADAFIDKLKEETATLRNLLEQSNQLNDRQTILENLMSELNNNQNSTPNTNDQQQPNKDNQPAVLSSDDIVKLIEARERDRQNQANWNKAKDELKKIHGDKTEEFIQKKANELGISESFLKDLGEKSPQAFLSALGHSANRQTSTPSPSVNSAAILNNPAPNDGVRNKAYYDGLLQTMGAKKFMMDRSLQVQMHKDLMSLGDSWD